MKCFLLQHSPDFLHCVFQYISLPKYPVFQTEGANDI